MIDFNAITRGQRAAQQDNQRDLAERRREEEFAFNRDQRMISLETQRWDRQAASYAAPLLGNMQQAADAGQDDITFLINQRKVVQEDPAFQAFPPEVQQRVLKQLGEAAQITAQQRLNAGDPAAARELYKAFGWQGQIPQQDVAFKTGDIGQIVSAIDPGGTLLAANPDGSYTYKQTGVVIPADRLAAVLAAGGGAQSLPLISATIQQENAKRAEFDALQLQQLRANYQQTAMVSGFTIPQPDGTFANAAGVVYPLPAELQAAMKAGPAAPAATAAVAAASIGAGVPSPAGLPTAPVTAAPGLPPALALPSTTTPVVPALPAAAAPEVAQGITQLQQFYGQAQALEPVLQDKRRLLAQVQAEIKTMPMSVSLGRFPAVVQSPERAKLVQQEMDLQREILQIEGNRKLIANEQIPALETQLAGATPAAWGQQFMQEIAKANATPAAAKIIVKQSPQMAGNYLRALTLRLAELQGQPGTEKEAAELIEARANLVAALADARPSPNRPTGGGGR